MVIRHLILFFFCFSLTAGLYAQNDKSWRLSGYVKDLQNHFIFNNSFPDLQTLELVDTFLMENFIHNRLNFEWFVNDALTFRTDLRTRLFVGDLARTFPTYGEMIDEPSNDVADLSFLPVDQSALVLHSVFDRLYLQYGKGDWEVRLGRQRINWGINTVWNPNDIFNAFDFTDFDYEERPGSDALRVKYYTGFASSLELAVKAWEDFDEAVIAGLWKFHQGSYDFQILSGLLGEDLAFGGGWAGNIGDASFKGEFTYFKSLQGDDDHTFAATTNLDYAFSNSLYVNIGYLYNGNGGINTPVTQLFNFEQRLSAKNLYPYRHSIFTQVQYPFTPLFNGGIAFIYNPVSVHALFINPTLIYSLSTNLDADLISQIVLGQETEGYNSPVQSVFLRLKYSF